MEVAELEAVLDVKIAPLIRGFAEADARCRVMEARLAAVEARVLALNRATDKTGASFRSMGQDVERATHPLASYGQETDRLITRMQRLNDAKETYARNASRELQFLTAQRRGMDEVGLATGRVRSQESALAADRERSYRMLGRVLGANDPETGWTRGLMGGVVRARGGVRELNNELTRTENIERRLAGGGGGGGGGGFLAGLLPGGRRAGAGAVTTGIVLAGTGIAPLIPALGILATAPAMLMTLVAGLGVTKLAFDDVGKAIGGNKKAYDMLVPAQKAFVDTIRNDIIPLVNGLKQTAASNFFGPLTDAIKGIAGNRAALANINGIVRDLARFMGQVAASWVKFLGSTAMTREIGQMFAAWLPILQSMTPIFESLFKSFVLFSTAIAPLGDFLVNAFGKGAQALADWLTQANKTGEFAHIIKTIEGSLELLWRTVKTVANVFGALYAVLAPIGRVVLPDILVALNFMADLIRRNAKLIGTDFLMAWQAIVDVVKLLAPLLQPMLKGALEEIRLLLVPIDAVARHLGFLKPVIEFLGGLFNNFGKYIAAGFLAPIVAVVAHWQGIVDPLTDVFTKIGNAFVWMINNFILKPNEWAINKLIDAYNALFGWATGNIGKLGLYQVPGIPTTSTYSGGAPSAGGVGPHSSPGGTRTGTNGAPGQPGSNVYGPPAPGTAGATPYVSAFGGTYRSPGRIDQGQDFSGAGPITAIGTGIVQRATRSGSGWPGGSFLSILLTEGRRAGWTYFIAEHFQIAPGLGSGSHVRAGQIVGHQTGGIEMGWVSSPTKGNRMSGSALESQLGMNAKQRGISSDPGGGGASQHPYGTDFASVLGAGTGFTPSPLDPTGGATPFTGGAAAARARQPSLLDQVLPPAMQASLARAQTRLAQAQDAAGSGGVAAIRKEIAAERAYIQELERVQKHLDAEHATVKTLVTLEKERKLIAVDLKNAHRDLTKEIQAQKMAVLTAKDLKLLAPFGHTVAGGSISLHNELDGILKEIRTGGMKISQATKNELAVISKIIEEQDLRKLPAVRDRIRALLDSLKTIISDRAAAIKSSLSGLASAFSALASTALSAFDAINQGWKSPSQIELERRQREDQVHQLQQALADAIAGGDPVAIAAARRAIEEDELAQRAADEQKAHDAELKVKRDNFERDMAALRVHWSKVHETVGQKAKDVADLLKRYGLTPESVQAATDWNTAQALFVGGMSDLVTALNDLTAAITGKAPPKDAVTPGPGGFPIAGGRGDKKHFPEAAMGGPVFGMDEVPIIAHAGEYVIRARAARRIGLHNLDRLNRYDEGGTVPETPWPPVVGGTSDQGSTPAQRAGAMFLNDYGDDKNNTYIMTALNGLIGNQAKYKAAMRATHVDGVQLHAGLWRAAGDPKEKSLWMARFPGIVFEDQTDDQISWGSALSRLQNGVIGGYIQQSLGLVGAASKVERMTSHAVHFATGYMTDAIDLARRKSRKGVFIGPDDGDGPLQLAPFVIGNPDDPTKLTGLATGGILTRSGFFYGHAGEAVTPAPAAMQPQSAEFHIYIDGEKVEKVVTARQLNAARFGGPGISPAVR